MTIALGQPPKAQFFDGDGNPLAAGKVYTTNSGQAPVITYTDPSKTSENTNPILLDARGETGIWADIAGYKISVYDSSNNLIEVINSYPLAPPNKATFYDAAGEPLIGGKVYTYAAGSSTLQATYADSGGLYENTNPVILDANGQADLWFGPNLYKIVLKTATDVEIYTVDNYGT